MLAFQIFEFLELASDKWIEVLAGCLLPQTDNFIIQERTHFFVYSFGNLENVRWGNISEIFTKISLLVGISGIIVRRLLGQQTGNHWSHVASTKYMKTPTNSKKNIFKNTNVFSIYKPKIVCL